MPDSAAMHAIVSGRVQGVYFRAFVARHARRLGLSGWVRNRPDGAVEVLAEGEKDRLEELVSRLRQGPPAARVSGVQVDWPPASGQFPDFTIRY